MRFTPPNAPSYREFTWASPSKAALPPGGMHEAISEDLGHLPVELHPGKGARYFALRVAGDSVIEADIRDGDYIILDKNDAAEKLGGPLRE